MRGKIAVAKAIYCTARPQLLRRIGDSVYLKEWGMNGGPPTSSATSSLYRVQTGWSRLAGQQQHAMVSAAAAQLSRRDWIGHLKKHIYDLAVADHTHTGRRDARTHTSIVHADDETRRFAWPERARHRLNVAPTQPRRRHRTPHIKRCDSEF